MNDINTIQEKFNKRMGYRKKTTQGVKNNFLFEAIKKPVVINRDLFHKETKYRKARAVLQFDSNDVFIKRHASISQAAECVGRTIKSIGTALRKGTKSAKCRWYYE